MKKIFVFIVLVLFLISFVFAADSTPIKTTVKDVAVTIPILYKTDSTTANFTGIGESATEKLAIRVKVKPNSLEDYSTDISYALQREPLDWSKKDACLFMRGCYESPMCYPFGYIKDEKYCSDELEKWGKISYGFADQKNYGGACKNNFECVSNLCSGGECIGPSEVGLVDYLNKKINELEERIIFLEQQLNPKFDNLATGKIVSENSVERKGFLGWFKNLF
jgi:hypothetical protein